MTEYDFEKPEILLSIAQQDDPYLVWHNCREEFASAFHDFVESQPEEIRNVLLGYTCAGDMMHQRLLNIACEHMDFINK